MIPVVVIVRVFTTAKVWVSAAPVPDVSVLYRVRELYLSWNVAFTLALVSDVGDFVSLRISYVFMRYPELSQTFAVSDVNTLRKKGHEDV